MTEKVTARLAGVAVNIVGKRLKAAELAIRYGTSVTPEGEKDLVLCHEATPEDRMTRIRRELQELQSAVA